MSPAEELAIPVSVEDIKCIHGAMKLCKRKEIALWLLELLQERKFARGDRPTPLGRLVAWTWMDPRNGWDPDPANATHALDQIKHRQWRELQEICTAKGYSRGWAFHRYVHMFDERPPQVWTENWYGEEEI